MKKPIYIQAAAMLLVKHRVDIRISYPAIANTNLWASVDRRLIAVDIF